MLSTTKGTAIPKCSEVRKTSLSAVCGMPGCAHAGCDSRSRTGVGIRVVCSGRLRRFVMEDGVASWVIAATGLVSSQQPQLLRGS